MLPLLHPYMLTRIQNFFYLNWDQIRPLNLIPGIPFNASERFCEYLQTDLPVVEAPRFPDLTIRENLIQIRIAANSSMGEMRSVIKVCYGCRKCFYGVYRLAQEATKTRSSGTFTLTEIPKLPPKLSPAIANIAAIPVASARSSGSQAAAAHKPHP
jgi:hypothetical protein